jgi:hypothetical protein
MKHLAIGGSTAARTLACPGWIKKSENIAAHPAGAAALEGSMHHEVMELCQKTSTTPEDHVGLVYTENGNSITFDEDHLKLSELAFKATEQLLNRLDIDELEIEPFVELIPNLAGGSIDFLGLSADRKTILIGDYKFGRVKVSPEQNAQMMFYAVAAMTDPKTKDLFDKVERFSLVIIQPRHRGTVFRWDTNYKTIKKFLSKIKVSIKQVQKKVDKGYPGNHCKWCPAEPYCPEKRQAIYTAATLGTKRHNELTISAAMVTEVEHWLKNTKEELFMQLTNGVVVPGWKIVEKRTTRKWKDAADAEVAVTKAGLGSDAYRKEFLTAPAMEKMLKKLKIEFPLDEFVEKKTSGNTLAPEGDSREAVIVTDIAGNLADLVKLK